MGHFTTTRIAGGNSTDFCPHARDVQVRSFIWLFNAIVFEMIKSELHAGEWSPVQYPLSRYEQIWKSSPFVAASEVSPQAESLAQRFAVTGFVRIGSSDVVFLFDRKSLSRFSIANGSPAQGVELVDVSETDDLALLRAKVRVEGQVAEIFYDAGVGGGESTGKSAEVSQQKPSTPLPLKIVQPQGDASSAANKGTSNTGKPAKVIRRKPIDVP